MPWLSTVPSNSPILSQICCSDFIDGGVNIVGGGWAADLLRSVESLPEDPSTTPDGFAGELRANVEDVRRLVEPVLPPMGEDQSTHLVHLLDEEIPEALGFINQQAQRNDERLQVGRLRWRRLRARGASRQRKGRNDGQTQAGG